VTRFRPFQGQMDAYTQTSNTVLAAAEEHAIYITSCLPVEAYFLYTFTSNLQSTQALLSISLLPR
jgi:hypothetical protein